jgi:hypothetical protein
VLFQVLQSAQGRTKLLFVGLVCCNRPCPQGLDTAQDVSGKTARELQAEDDGYDHACCDGNSEEAERHVRNS